LVITGSEILSYCVVLELLDPHKQGELARAFPDSRFARV
jgi:hypothetical protein